MKDRWWKFGRDDYAFLRGVLGVMVLLCVVMPVIDVGNWVMGEALHWRSTSLAAPPAVTDPGTTGATGTWGSEVSWVIPHATAGQWLGSMLPGIWNAVAACLAAAALWRLVRSLEQGVAFTDASVRAVRSLGLVLLGYIVFGWVIALFSDQLVMMPLRHGGFAWGFELRSADLALMVVAVMVVALAELFRQGRDLARDVEGLV